MKRSLQSTVDLLYFQPSERLRPFVTTFYQIRINAPPGAQVQDWLHPEWAHLRLFAAGPVCAAVGEAPYTRLPEMVVFGPTSKSTRFSVGSGRFWGIGLLPLGWAQLVRGDASVFADCMTDIDAAEGMGHLAALRELRFNSPENLAAEAQAIDDVLIAILDKSGPVDGRVSKIHALLVDETICGVGELADRAGMTARTLERFCKRWFGFAPSLLLARQRFLRCLGRFMLDPSLSWLSILEGHYYDQAHFVRDFHRFMQMSPSEYARIPHPVLTAAAEGRERDFGAPVQVLHKPQFC